MNNACPSSNWLVCRFQLRGVEAIVKLASVAPPPVVRRPFGGARPAMDADGAAVVAHRVRDAGEAMMAAAARVLDMTNDDEDGHGG